jgi:hypothetical protein
MMSCPFSALRNDSLDVDEVALVLRIFEEPDSFLEHSWEVHVDLCSRHGRCILCLFESRVVKLVGG